ncbi:MAG: iron export ABC transporter permease subunit FetB [Anaerolineae bacterium]|nr:iron export ABC transporter permease subunit FetB [Anaerolineae bacterium]
MSEIRDQIDIVITDLGDLHRIGLALALVALAILISRWQRAGLEQDLIVATVRSFVQLIAIGYALDLIFAQDHPLWTTLMLMFMITVAGYTAGQRGKGTPHATAIALIAIAVGSFVTISVLVIAGVFDYVPQNIIPIGGMVIGNAMAVAAQVLHRLPVDLHENRAQIESLLALGATRRDASQIQFRRALRTAMIPHIDTAKTVGLIKLPGAMTGMILAGASPLEAVQLQIIVMYMLLGAMAFTGLCAAWLTYRALFTAAHQLRTIRVGQGR